MHFNFSLFLHFRMFVIVTVQTRLCFLHVHLFHCKMGCDIYVVFVNIASCRVSMSGH